MLIRSALLPPKTVSLTASNHYKTFNAAVTPCNDSFISTNHPNISFRKASGNIIWPTINKGNLIISDKQYTELLQILEEGIELIRNKDYKKAIEHFSDKNNAQKTGITVNLIKDEYEKPPVNMEETQLLYQAMGYCAVDQKKSPLVLNLGVVLVKNNPKTKEEKKFLETLYHAQAYVCLHEWLHVLQNSFKGLISQSLGGIKIDHSRQEELVQVEGSKYNKSLSRITNMMVIESDTWKFLSEQGIPIPKNIFTTGNPPEYNHGYFFDDKKSVKYTNLPGIPYSEDLYIRNTNVAKAISKMETGQKLSIGRHADIIIYRDKSCGILDKHIQIEKLPNGKYRISYCDNSSDCRLEPDVSFKDNNNDYVFFEGRMDLPRGMYYDAEPGTRITLGESFCNLYLP